MGEVRLALVQANLAEILIAPRFLGSKRYFRVELLGCFIQHAHALIGHAEIEVRKSQVRIEGKHLLVIAGQAQVEGYSGNFGI